MCEPSDWILRPFDPATDAAAVAGIDTSFVTDRVFEVVREDAVPGAAGSDDPMDGLRLRTRALAVPVEKRFEIDIDATDAEDAGDRESDGAGDGHGDDRRFAAVAVAGGRVVGFVEARVDAWNRRLVIRHLYVDRVHRRRGIGRALAMRAVAFGESARAVTAWVETSHLNVPGAAAWRRLGFALCGFDLALYQGTACRDEFAVFLSRRLEGDGSSGRGG